MNKPKFRAWDTWNKRMITEFGGSNRVKTKDGSNYVDLQARKDGTVKAVLMEFKNSGIFTRPVEDLPTMQYTGLKDKNGVEIYESDILNYGDYKKSHEVIFRNGCFWGHAIGEEEQIGIGLFNALEDLEVCGNVHENPELLNEVEK